LRKGCRDRNPDLLFEKVPTEFQATIPTDIVLNKRTGRYTIADNATHEVFIVNSAGVSVSHFDIGVSGCNTPSGIAYKTSANQYGVTDAAGHTIYFFDLDLDG
jgi:hypothetical protein